MSAPAAAPAPHEVLVVDADQPRAPGPRPVVDVAVGVLIDRDGRFLLTTRPSGKAYAGHWEFPGGKVEPGETVEQALRRELQEEIGVTIGAAHPWRVLEADYPHARVRLHVCRVHDWRGELQMHEGQAFAWQTLPVTVAPVLPGTWPLLRWMGQEGGPEIAQATA
ncbi:NUDIX domain-containing protein [Tepidimonas sp.]|uniref:NUDIX domain-containing protein n=1 Tax=Tepidimonas sp. TaxID=2002775 RepID=UPI00391BC1A9